jgi:periplasmic divalent cation tolerance protein
VKTTVKNFAEVRDAIRGLHSYEVPECISLPVDDGSTSYLQWIDDSVK